jgi:hypothetical protein
MARRAAKTKAKQHDPLREKIHRSYCERHPARAAEQRALRLEQATLHRDHGRYRPAATPETLQKLSQVSEGTLSRMYLSGQLDADQLAFAAEIVRVHNRISADVAIGTMSMETRVSGGRGADGTFFEKLGLVRAEVAYTKWRASLKRADVVLTIVIEDLACRQAERRFSMRNGSAKKLLLDALDAWPHFQSEARDEVDDATLLAAQAGILS